MKLEWHYDEERGTDEAVTDYGVFRIMLDSYHRYTLAHSDPELNCCSSSFATLKGAKHAADQRYAEILAKEVTR